MRLRSGDRHHLRKSAGRKAQISSVSGTNAFLICAFRSADFLRWCLSPERNLTHNLFLILFPIAFGINLIHFFDEKKGGAAGNSIVCFAASNPRHAIWQCEVYEECELFRRVQRFWQRKCKCVGKERVNSSPILAQQWWRHFRLSLYFSLSLSLSLSRRAHLPRFLYM